MLESKIRTRRPQAAISTSRSLKTSSRNSLNRWFAGLGLMRLLVSQRVGCGSAVTAAMTSSTNAQNAFCDASSCVFPSRPLKYSENCRRPSPDVISVVSIGAGRDSNRSSPIPVLPAVSRTAACSVLSVDDNADTAWAFVPSVTISRPCGAEFGDCSGPMTAVSVSPRAVT